MSKRDNQKKKNRIKITDAYINLLGKKNFQAITVTEICQEAGVARKTLYGHFASKEDILDKISEQIMFTAAIDAFTKTLKLYEGTSDRLDETFSQLSIPLGSYSGENMEVFVQLIQNMTMHLSAYSSKFIQFHEAAYNYFSECKKNEDTKNDFDVGFIADLTVNASVGVILSWVSDQNYPAKERMQNVKEHIASLIICDR